MKFSQFSHSTVRSWTKNNAVNFFGAFLIALAAECFALAQTPESVLATVNDKQISQADVDATIVSQLFPLQQQIYALRKSALDNLVTRAVLEAEAKKRRIPVDELKKQLTTKEVVVTPSQVEAVYQENASAFAAMSPDEAKERLRLDLESQARMRHYRTALAALKSSAKIEVRLEEPRLPLSALGNAAVRGPEKARVTIVEFSDFQCPYCREAQTVVKQILKEYPNDVRMSFKHLPLDIHDRAFASAQAAFCAGEQNQFWPYHDALFAANDLSAETIGKIAASVGLDMEKFKACVASEASRAAVMSDLQEARRLGINSTPTFVVNGKPLRGTLGFVEFKKLIDRELNPPRVGLSSTQHSSPEQK